MSECKVNNCDGRSKALGYCSKHYQRAKRFNDPEYQRGHGLKECSIEGCDRSPKSTLESLCHSHYRRKNRYGDPLATAKDFKEMVSCKVDGCDRRSRKLGFCTGHYSRFKNHGDPRGEIPLQVRNNICKVSGCEREAVAKQLCKTHYGRQRTYGNVLADLPIKTPSPKGSGHLDPVRGYRTISRNKRTRGEHIWVMEEYIGRELYPDETVHHINGVRDDNRLENLELWSSSHPKGQRVKDKLEWAYEMIERYAVLENPELNTPEGLIGLAQGMV